MQATGDDAGTAPGRTALGVDIARLLHRGDDLPMTAEVAVGLAVSLVAGCDAAGISLVRKGRVTTVALSDPVVAQGDQWQYELGEGPCLDVMRSFQDELHSPDLRLDDRWPRWAPRVVSELGVMSMLSYRLFTTDELVGALNLYAHAPGAFTEEDHHAARMIAAQAAPALATQEQLDHLKVAVGRRTVIGQAQGILMERFTLEPDAAFSVLVRLSRHRNEKLHDVAEALVRTRQVPEDPQRARV
jgi:GAF domain-containing protein